MSYDIQLFRRETKEREQKSDDEAFFDHKANLEPFTKLQYGELKQRLLDYGYVIQSETGHNITFTHSQYSIDALLTDRGLYFTTSFNEEDIFEAGMTASEFTDTEDFVKYDPQYNGWEEI